MRASLQATHRELARPGAAVVIVALGAALAVAGAGCGADPRASEPALRPVWTAATGEAPFGPPAAGAGLAVAADAAGTLRALDVRSGDARWTATLAGPATGAPVLDAERVFTVTRAGEVQALDRLSGATRWSASLAAEVTAGLALSAGRLFVVTTAGVVRCFPVDGGDPLWTADLAGVVAVTPGASDAALFVATFDGRVVRLDPATGALAWEARPDPTYVIGTPLLAGSQVVAPGYEDTILGLSAADGNTVWSRYAGNYLVALPVMRDGLVFFGSAQGPITAVDPADGAVRWTLVDVLFGRQAILVPFAGDLLVVDHGGPVTWIAARDGARIGIVDLGFEVDAVALAEPDGMLVVAAGGVLHGLAVDTGGLDQ